MMRAVADALNVDARVFPEYRLALARDLFDETNEGGLEAALANLSLLNAALEAAGEAGAPPARPGR
jgi:hypothetical protein